MFRDRNGHEITAYRWIMLRSNVEYKTLGYYSNTLNDTQVSTVYVGLGDRLFETLICIGEEVYTIAHDSEDDASEIHRVAELAASAGGLEDQLNLWLSMAELRIHYDSDNISPLEEREDLPDEDF